MSSNRFQFELRDLLLATTFFAFAFLGIVNLVRSEVNVDFTPIDVVAVLFVLPSLGAGVGALIRKSLAGFFIGLCFMPILLIWLAAAKA